ncbi:ecotin family protein [Photobacterium leiognathi]|uniref:ecotin family protein n=1 Tax=Photobacterium leiognathi TaxID=553611 RepID=UPI002981DB9B|nr:ecotin family protein [Photobacterium leiognathi]
MSKCYLFIFAVILSITLTTEVIAKNDLVGDIPEINIETYYQTKYQSIEAIKMFPPPTAKQKMYVLTLPKLTEEQNYKIEIEVGKTLQLDCNRHYLLSKIKRQSLVGWGYIYYSLEDISKLVSTRKGCLNSELKLQFVTQSKPLVLTYNSRLPLVFYVPKAAQLRYRIWRTDNNYIYN